LRYDFAVILAALVRYLYSKLNYRSIYLAAKTSHGLDINFRYRENLICLYCSLYHNSTYFALTLHYMQ